MSKVKSFRLDSEVERCRNESNFRRLAELLPQVSNKSSGLESLTNFFTGESLLETFLDGFETLPAPDPFHRDQLRKAKKHLLAVLEVQQQQQHSSANNNGNVSPQRFNNIVTETHLLLAKIYYIGAHFDDCISAINKAKIDQDGIDLTSSLRTLRLAAEGFALKAMCFEAQTGHKLTSKFQKSNREDQIVLCYEHCIRLAIQYLRDYDRFLAGSASLHNLGTQISTSSSATTPAAPVTIVPSSASMAGNQLSAGVGAQASLVAPMGPTSFPSSAPPTPGRQDPVGLFLTAAMSSLPSLYAKRQELIKSIDCYRKLLLNVDRPFAQPLQQSLCQNLAMMLLRGISNKLYRAPTIPGVTPTSPAHRKADSLIGGTAAPPSMEQNTMLTNEFQLVEPFSSRRRKSFCPEQRLEEIFLLLSMSEAIGCKDAVLSRADDHLEAREKSLSSVKAVHDLLTVTLCQVRQYGLLSEMFERAMKFAYDDHFVWFQFAASLLSLGRYGRAYSILKQSLLPESQLEGCDDLMKVENQIAQYLLGSKLCFEQLGLYDEGVEFSTTALRIAQHHGHLALISRAHLLTGLCYSLKAQATMVFSERQHLIDESLRVYHLAQRADPRDPNVDFFLALQLALSWRLGEAEEVCREALTKNPEQPVALMLMALLLSADNQYIEALHLVEQALDDFPTHYGLLVLRLKLEMKLQRAGGALLTAKDLLLFWRLPTYSSSPDRYSFEHCSIGGGENRPGTNDTTAASQTGASESNAAVAAGASVANSAPGVDLADKESLFSSVRPMTEYGGAVSTVSDSLGFAASNVSRDVMSHYRMQSNIWLELAELFLNTDDYLEEVQECCDEACSTFPNSHQVLYLKGRLHQRGCRFEQAKSCFVASLGLCPGHLPSARCLAETFEKLGNHRMAERVLRQIVNVEPYDHDAWKGLSILLAKCQKFKEAAQCADTASNLEDSAPIMPFNVIPRILHVQ